MDIKSEFETLALHVRERKEHVHNEEATKQSLIIPFIQKLGYDVFNPLEVQPEYTADYGIKKGEKVDYAIKKNQEIIFFIEAKPVYEGIDKHSAQLYRYFNATPSVRFSILTNGIDYKLFSDLNQDNVMDKEPFYSFTMNELNPTDYEVIGKLMKERFNKENMIKYSQELVYLANINATLKNLFKNPSDDFVRFLIRDIKKQKLTTNVIDKFRPIIKKAINKTVLEMIGEGLSGVEKGQEKDMVSEDAKTEKQEGNEKNIHTTEEELEGYKLVCGILKEAGINEEHIKFKDNRSYFTIMEDNVNHWFIRFFFDATNKNVVVRYPHADVQELYPKQTVVQAPTAYGEDVARLYLTDVHQLNEMKEVIELAYESVNGKH